MTTRSIARAIAPSCLVVALTVASVACSDPRDPSSRAEPLTASIAVQLVIASPVDERMRAACADDVLGALRRHRIVIAELGTPVSIEVWLSQDVATHEPLSNELGAQGPRFVDARLPTTASFAAEIKATVDAGGAARVLRAAGTSSSPCAVAGERFGEQLIALIGVPDRQFR